MDFNPQQQHSLLKQMGYDGPTDPKMMEAFLSSNPGAAARMGKFSRVVKKRAGMAEGGLSAGEQLSEAIIQNPESLTETADVAEIRVTPGTLINPNEGQVGTAPVVQTSTVGNTEDARAPRPIDTATFRADTSADDVRRETNRLDAEQGTVSGRSQVRAAEGRASSGSLAGINTVDPRNVQQVTPSQMNVQRNELVTAAGQDETAVQSLVAQSAGIANVANVQGVVNPKELPAPALIADADMAQAKNIVAQGLAPDAVAVAAQLKNFSVSNETLALAAQGDVTALDTVQGQLADLMKSFDNGQTPAWAAGAMRAANAAMASRGLGGSSMAGAAIFQAAMESALPIAQQDAQVFANMNLSNLNNRQQVALANAAAQQGLQLQNLDNRQKAALQNSSNAFSLQSQNLSNMQQTMLANAQIKAAFQGQNLSNKQQANLVTAARYAEVANINLNNRQQAALQNNTNSLNIEMANLSNKQQAYLANAQLEASLQGKQIDNQQQAAMANAARFSEAANITFTAKQQAALHNSELMKTIGLANLDARQATTLQNAATIANMDMANLNNRQQAAVQNAQAFLQMDMANLDNRQQTSMFRAQSNIQAMFTDQAAVNAARQFNASSENQTNQFFADLSSRVSMFNAEQGNAMRQFNAGETNTNRRFNAQLRTQRDQFNANNSLVIAQANAQWRQNVATINTAAQNTANLEAVRAQNGLTTQALDNIWQTERDTLAFAFQSYESAQDRATQLLLADKAEKASEAQNKAAFFFKMLFG